MAILVTGGAGYIGTHTCVELLNDGYEVVVVDNLYNSKLEAIKRVEQITDKKIKFYEGDILDKECLEKIFTENKIESVIHFAGYKAVAESVALPWKYYYNNITGTLVLLEVMKEHNCKELVFSSSATVYGQTQTMPLVETMPTAAFSPYGQTKLMIEQILTDIAKADPEFKITLLRYFNPIGAHNSGLIGEDPKGIPNNLLPFIIKVVAGQLPTLSVFGDDYNTTDGTAIRDYIHVVDLAQGHLAALKTLNDQENNLEIYNLGTGIGYSVLDVVKTFEKVNDVVINYVIGPRRSGDVEMCYADAHKAKNCLHWEAKYDLSVMCKDSYNWLKKNPEGF